MFLSSGVSCYDISCCWKQSQTNHFRTALSVSVALSNAIPFVLLVAIWLAPLVLVKSSWLWSSTNYNVFVSGRAGTGKSFLLKYIVENSLTKRGTFLTAPTGIAASNIGGRTIHSFAGVGLARQSVYELASAIGNKPDVLQRWLDCSVLVIDELSCLSPDLFGKLELIGRIIRERDELFGGIRVIGFGDFYQLGPVVSTSKSSGSVSAAHTTVFVFEMPLWHKVFHASIELSCVYRQTDQAFVNMLDEIRVGIVSDKTKELLQHLQQPTQFGMAETIRLVPTRAEALEHNLVCLSLLPGLEKRYKSTDSVFCDNPGTKIDFPTAKVLVLKLNAQVVLVQNIDDTFVNGLRGVVSDFVCGWPKVVFVNGVSRVFSPVTIPCETGNGLVLGTRSQVPLQLAWALTIHKSQGLTLPSVQVCLKSLFEPGQMYVALSRAKSLEGLQVISFEIFVTKATEHN